MKQFPQDASFRLQFSVANDLPSPSSTGAIYLLRLIARSRSPAFNVGLSASRWNPWPDRLPSAVILDMRLALETRHDCSEIRQIHRTLQSTLDPTAATTSNTISPIRFGNDHPENHSGNCGLSGSALPP